MSAAAGTATGAATASDAPRVPGGAASAAAPPGQAGGPVAQAREDEQRLRDQLWQARRERDEYLETLQRVQAEYDNDRRRARQQQSEQHERGAQALAERLLPVLDAFDAARPHAPDVLAPLHDALTDALHAAGLERLEPTGEPFDPAEQHAVEQLPRQAAVTPVEDGREQVGHAPSVVVHGVLRPGYRWRGRLMRPAMVRVHSE